MRSAMMLRSTSEVPPPTVSAGLKRNPRAHWLPLGSRADREHAGAPIMSLARPNTRLPCGSFERLAQRRVRSRLLVHRGRDLPELVIPQDLTLDVRGGEPLPDHRRRCPRVRASATRSRTVGPYPHCSPPRSTGRPVRWRASPWPWPSRALSDPDEVLRWQVHVGEEHFAEARVAEAAHHVPQRPDLDARQVHRHDEVRDSGVLAGVGVGPGDQDAELRHLGQRRPDLLTVDHEHITIAYGSGAEVGQIGTGVGLGEELAPQFLASQHRHEVPLPLFLAAVHDEDRSAVADADRVHRSSRLPGAARRR